FLGTAISVFALYHTLREQEFSYARNLVREDLARIRQLIEAQTNGRLFAIKRMAQRWEARNGTPFEQWRQDADNYIGQIKGLRTLEWVDSTYHVRWAEPLRGNERAIGLDIRFDAQRAAILKGAADSKEVTVTPPLDLMQGYKGFLVYAPIRVHHNFDGFIVGI